MLMQAQGARSLTGIWEPYDVREQIVKVVRR